MFVWRQSALDVYGSMMYRRRWNRQQIDVDADKTHFCTAIAQNIYNGADEKYIFYSIGDVHISVTI